MATKNTKSAGNYLIQATKMCEWKTDLKERLIFVPENELERANNDLICDHLRAHGFHIQSCIEAEKNNVFNPEIRLKQRTVIEVAKSEFYAGLQIIVPSSDCELEVVRVEGSKIELKYLNRKKHNLLISEEQLKINLSRKVWIKC